MHTGKWVMLRIFQQRKHTSHRQSRLRVGQPAAFEELQEESRFGVGSPVLLIQGVEPLN